MFAEELTLTTPSILFSAVSLILLAYTNRFLSYAQVIRNLKAEHDKNPSSLTQRQLDNLRKRLYMSRSMQIFGISSLLLCVLCTFLIYVGLQAAAVYTFGIALLLLVVSLWISIREVLISVKALEVYLNDMKMPVKEERAGQGSHPRRARSSRPKATYTDPNTLTTTTSVEAAISASGNGSQRASVSNSGNAKSASRSRGRSVRNKTVPSENTGKVKA